MYTTNDLLYILYNCDLNQEERKSLLISNYLIYLKFKILFILFVIFKFLITLINPWGELDKLRAYWWNE